MRIFDGKSYRNMTPEEVAEREERTLYEESHRFDSMSYPEIVVVFIRERYTLDDELAIHRQKDSKPDEWNTYNAYCEDCKTKAREIVKNTETFETEVL